MVVHRTDKKRGIISLDHVALVPLAELGLQDGHPTLGVFRPGRIKEFKLKPTEHPNWTANELAILNQARLDLGGNEPKQQLEKIPFEFRYEFACDDPLCRGHNLMCTDWEMGQSYRSWRRRYGGQWE